MRLLFHFSTPLPCTLAYVDECAIFTPAESCPDSRARCVNTQGSYICVCPEGFVWIGYPDLKCKGKLVKFVLLQKFLKLRNVE
ncbi:unnamed protein product [Trichobilharzia regenti]|nr:unnamed protein product [Trichobilharzia regenti]